MFDGVSSLGYCVCSYCGSITITDGVTSVTARTSDDNPGPNSIGAGTDGNCGTVTIGGIVYWDGSSYQNDGDKDTHPGLKQDTYTYAPNLK